MISESIGCKGRRRQISNPIQVILVDDHPLYREGLRTVVERDGRFVVVAEASSAEDANSKVLKHKPDLLLVDLFLGRGSGHAVIEFARNSSPTTKVVVISMSSDEKDIRQSLASGACGYVNKLAEHNEILWALTQVSQGHRYICGNLLTSVLQAELLPILTKREEELLALLYNGTSPKECADQMSCTYHTVKAHLRSLYRKTKTPNLGLMLLKAQKWGLIGRTAMNSDPSLGSRP